MHFEASLIFLTAFVLGLSIFPVFIRLYTKNNILDRRDHRKVHLNEVPTMGGVPILIAFTIALFIWFSNDELAENRYILGALLFMLFIGLRDDFISLKPVVKLVSQLVPSLLIFYLTNLKIESLYGFISSTTFPVYLSLIITVITIIVITNSVNLIDGLDGLAGTISFVILMSFGLWFFIQGDHPYGMLLYAMAGAIFAFLQFNWQPAKIFMGDTGALILGFLIAVSTIKFITLNNNLPVENYLRFNGIIATALAVLIIPLFDTLRIFTIRVIKGKSPFSPDKNHLHHTLMRLGLSHKQVSLLLALINFAFIGLAILFNDVSDNILVPSLFGLCLLLALILDYIFIKFVLAKRDRTKTVLEIIKSSKKAS